ncbi:hypothetical protein VPNG_09442 [Cytospora leucostoma]|uniref:Geranylgeranyl transferase type-2 subunit alpha n=1 Tax=Cytospora leucostoma TaxID=1230097 RepID=A0A423VPT6_9PEZI|nr:hypothetical protein VPNG_09442 [Cytospora leucostoma]
MASHGVARTNRSRTEEQKQQELEKIQKYRSLDDQVRSLVADNNIQSPELLKLTTKLLRLNPEYYTIWNPNPESQTTGRNGTTADDAAPAGEDTPVVDEKAKAQQNDLAVLRSELSFTVPLLMEFPKCYWIWKYRSWLLQQAIERLDPPVARRIWEEELGLDTKMLTKDRRNFHAWGYRRTVVGCLESAALNGKSMVESEFEFTTKMIRADLSNFSAWHNRSKLIPRLLDERGADDNARKTFFDEELALIKEGLNVGPDDQSLWYYHQFLMLDIFEHAGRPTITASFTLGQRVSYVEREIVEIKDLLEDYDDSKLIYEALIEYTLALPLLTERKPSGDELVDLRGWLSTLQQLDPMRKGRWNDMEKDLDLLAG